MTLVKAGVRRGAEVLWRKQWEGSPWASKMHLMTAESLAEYETVAQSVLEAYFLYGAPERLTVSMERENAELRAERVKLQDENESLRHDLGHARDETARLGDYLLTRYRTFAFEGSAVDFAMQVMDAYRAGEQAGERADAELHKRIDSVVEIIGTRLDQIVEENAHSHAQLYDRVDMLERLAEQRGERLASLEERQHQDDLDRAAGEGMPDAPERPTHSNGLQAQQETGIDGLRDATIAEEFGERTPPRLRVAVNLGLGKDYGVGDWVKVSPCRSAGGHRDVMAGWYPVVGITAAQHNGPSAQVQIKIANVLWGGADTLVWIADRCVIDARPASEGSGAE